MKRRPKRQAPQLQIVQPDPAPGTRQDKPLSRKARQILKAIFKHYGRTYGRTVH